MIIIGIDPGVERTGYAVFNKISSNNIKYVTSGLIHTKKTTLHEQRLLLIFESLHVLLKKYTPDRVVLEKIFFFKNQKTLIQVAQSQGIILLIGAQFGLPVTFLTPLQIKQTITGYGQSDKKGVQKMLGLTLGLKDEVKQDDQADAIACAYAYCCVNQDLV